VPAGNTVIFSAHGVSKDVRAEAESRGLRVYDATCPLVTKVHIEVAKMRQEGFDIVMIGHKGHPEVEGTMGQAAEGMYLVEDIEDVDALQLADPERIAFVTQTTLSVDDAAEIIVGHLLRHAESPGCSQVHGAAVRRGDRGGQPEQFQFKPIARSR
jgi:4-hydroxy-3-methylbut-2-enyl diphosphate reductase